MPRSPSVKRSALMNKKYCKAGGISPAAAPLSRIFAHKKADCVLFPKRMQSACHAVFRLDAQLCVPAFRQVCQIILSMFQLSLLIWSCPNPITLYQIFQGDFYKKSKINQFCQFSQILSIFCCCFSIFCKYFIFVQQPAAQILRQNIRHDYRTAGRNLLVSERCSSCGFSGWFPVWSIFGSCCSCSFFSCCLDSHLSAKGKSRFFIYGFQALKNRSLGSKKPR